MRGVKSHSQPLLLYVHTWSYRHGAFVETVRHAIRLSWNLLSLWGGDGLWMAHGGGAILEPPVLSESSLSRQACEARVCVPLGFQSMLLRLRCGGVWYGGWGMGKLL